MKTTKEFVKELIEKHSDKFDYSKVIYRGAHEKIIVVCRKHGEFYPTANNHLRGSGCPKCWEKHNFTKDVFFERAIKVHGDRYDYSKVVYKNSYTPVEIICKKHDSFFQKPSDHWSGCNCPKCSKEKANFDLIVPWDVQVEKAKEKHGNKYTYIKKDSYTDSRDKATIICPFHGKFEQRFADHIFGEGCPFCSREKMIKAKTLTTEDFVKKARDVHGERYDYSLVEYVGATKKKVDIVCPKHGIFKQLPSAHAQGVGCPSCNSSKLEKVVEEILIKRKEKFCMQYMNENMKNIRLFKYDFLVKDALIVECQGVQHYKPINYFGGVDAFKKQINWDKMKKETAIKNGFSYLEIPYFLTYEEIENLIEEKLSD